MPSAPSTSAVPAHLPRDQAQLLDDVARTWRAWRQAPVLGLLTVGVGVLPALAAVQQPAVAVLATLLALLLLGWTLTERLWLLRLWTGRELSLREARTATLRCFGRMLVLLLVAALAGLVLLVPLGAVLLVQGRALDAEAPGWVAGYVAVATVLLYAAFTFVTPALAFSTGRVGAALRIGLRLLTVSLPSTAAYVLLPALVAAVAALLPTSTAVHVAVAAVTALLLGLARGATAAYYVRTVPGAGPDGSIDVSDRPTYSPPPSGW